SRGHAFNAPERHAEAPITPALSDAAACLVHLPGMPEVRAEMLLTWMELIDFYTLQRALNGLTQDEFTWKPHSGAWGVARREDCSTPSPGGAPGSERVVDT